MPPSASSTPRSTESAFRCRRCGTCCRWEGHVLLTGEDIRRLALHCGLPERAFIDRFTVLAENRAGLSLADAVDGACVFLAGSRCTVYPARPGQCRDFQRTWTVRDGCPGSAPTADPPEAPEGAGG